MTFIIEIEIGLGRRIFPPERLFINKQQSARILMRTSDDEIEVAVRQIGDVIDVVMHPSSDRDANIHWQCATISTSVRTKARLVWNMTGQKWQCHYRLSREPQDPSRR